MFIFNVQDIYNLIHWKEYNIDRIQACNLIKKETQVFSCEIC